ncbi:MAG: PAS domain-containing sensor histidine kinase [Bacteroidota bacterium]|nr:PAS domain-containing sensor histidine kinase [Bacteroidota bacterium]
MKLHHKIESELQSEAEFYSALVGDAEAGLFIVDEHKKHIFSNPAFESFLGYKSQELQEVAIYELAHPDDRQKVNTFFKKIAITKGTTIAAVARFRHKNGTYRELQLKGKNLLTSPRVKGILITVFDDSAPPNLQRDLKHGHEFYRNLLNVLPHPIWITGWDGRFIIVNEEYAQSLGLELGNITGKTFEEIGMSATLAEKYLKANREILLKQEPAPPYRDDFYNPSTRTHRIFLVRKIPIIVGEETCVLAIAFDLTDLENTKELLKENYSELSRVNKNLDRLIYSAGHELRGPITTIRGIVSLAKNEKDTDAMRHLLSLVEASLEKQEKIVRDLIITAQNQEERLKIERIDFNMLTDGIIDSFKYHPHGKKIRMTFTVDQQKPFYSDPERIELILSNLVSNALKYHNPDNPHPYIRISVDTGAAGAEICVKDNGLGIEHDYQDRVFELFFRATTVGQGTGLGLFIVKEIVGKLKGKIKLKSLPKKGTEFRISLPSLVKA